MRRCGPDDFEIVKRIVTDDAVLDFLIDDGVDKNDVSIAIGHVLSSPSWVVLAPNELCLFIFEPRNSVTWELHLQSLPEYRGRMVKDGLQAFTWMFTNTNCKKLLGCPCAVNYGAVQYCKKLGMVEHGLITKAWFKNNELYDILIMGQTKQEWQEGV